MNDTDRSILTYSEAGRAALKEIERLNALLDEAENDLGVVNEVITKHFAYVADDDTEEPLSPAECVEAAARDMRVTARALAEVRAERWAAHAEIERLTAERDAEKARADALIREVGALNDALGIVDLCQVEPMVQGFRAERDAARAEVERLRRLRDTIGEVWAAHECKCCGGVPECDMASGDRRARKVFRAISDAYTAALSETP